MQRNVGSVDKVLRLVFGVALAAWGILAAGVSATPGLIATVVGAILILTGLVGFCPLYKLLGINSHRV